MADVAILIPTLGRPHLIDQLVNSIYETTDRARPVFICNKHDNDVIDKINTFNEQIIYVKTKPGCKGDYARKINTGFKNTSEPLLFLGATDLIFKPWWLEAAEKHLGNGIHVVGTNDLGNSEVIAGRHATHFLVTREYGQQYGTIDRPNTLLCEEYWHEFVDNEFLETAKYRNAYAMALDSKVEHAHPFFGKGVWDGAYRNWKKRTIYGAQVFERRKALWT